MTDNGAIFTAEYRKGRCAMELEQAALGIVYKHFRPYHPQTCGKAERFHQTLKRWLAKQPAPVTVAELRAQLDWFRSYYNTRRPHRALARRTPVQAFSARTKAASVLGGVALSHHRVRRDKIDKAGKVTLRYQGTLIHIGVGRRYTGVPVVLLVANDDVRVITTEGELIGHVTVDPSRSYQPQNRR